MNNIVRTAGWCLAGFVMGSLTTAVAESSADKLMRKLDLLAEVFAQIENHFVDPVPAERLIYGAAKGAVESLDENSAFFTPEEYQELVDATQGEYAGIGVELSWDDDYPRILTVLPQSPADRVGVMAGDTLMRVERLDVSALSMETLQAKLKGPAGTRVTIEVQRTKDGPLKRFTMARAWVRVPPFTARQQGKNLHVITLRGFPKRTVDELEQYLNNHAPIAGLVLDMRDNPGGLFDEAVHVCDLFLERGRIVAAIGRNNALLEERAAHKKGTQPNYPVAIVLNENSASAAEVVAGALQDRGRARVFGQRSFGKGSVQSMLNLADGSGLKVTVARYVTPSGRQIEGKGVQPDVLIKNENKMLDAAVRWVRQQLKAR